MKKLFARAQHDVTQAEQEDMEVPDEDSEMSDIEELEELTFEDLEAEHLVDRYSGLITTEDF